MGTAIWVQLVIAFVGGSGSTSAFNLARRLLTGASAREEREEAAELTRQAARIGSLEELIDLLRHALDKHLIRESAIVSAAELLIVMINQALDQLDDPPPALLRSRDRAMAILTTAQSQIREINRGGK